MFISDKLSKTLGKDTIEELESMDESELRNVIVQASDAMKQAKEELDGNVRYQDLKAKCNAMTEGKKAIDKRQKARIQYALDKMAFVGKMDISDRLAYDRDLVKKREEQARKAAAAKAKLEAAMADGIDADECEDDGE